MEPGRKERLLLPLQLRVVVMSKTITDRSTAAVALDRSRLAVIGGMVVFTAAAWLYLAFVAMQMGDMSSVLSMPMTPAWSPAQAALMVLMWAVMMAAMMLPSAIPMVLAYDRMDQGSSSGRTGSTPLFVAGYVTMWATFAVGATALQWALHTMTLVNGMGVVTQSWFSGALLIGAGLIQFTPGKVSSLGACRTPMGFLMTSWRDGKTGAFRMGLHHGTLCLGCCWSLMILLFVLGVMNLAWVAVLAAFVLAEKVAPKGEIVSKIGGLALVLIGIGVLLGG
jgi:predicted metal-binding membrane protein